MSTANHEVTFMLEQKEPLPSRCPMCRYANEKYTCVSCELDYCEKHFFENKTIEPNHNDYFPYCRNCLKKDRLQE